MQSSNRQILDHTPSQYPQHRDSTLFLSTSEYERLRDDNDWIRIASEEEIQALLETRYNPCLSQADNASDWVGLYSFEGTQYLPVTILKTAPGHIWRQATGHLRLFCFEEHGK